MKLKISITKLVYKSIKLFHNSRSAAECTIYFKIIYNFTFKKGLARPSDANIYRLKNFERNPGPEPAKWVAFNVLLCQFLR